MLSFKGLSCVRLLGALFFLVLLAGPAHAQFLNRAIWLGSEEEGFRRDFDQDSEYFVDRASYVDLPTWWRAGSIDPFRNRVSIAGGSVTADDLTLETAVNLGLDLGKGFTFRANHLGSEHQTTRFQRFAVGFDVAVAETGSFLFQIEGDAGKARADASLGAEFLRSEQSAHRVLFTLADWSDGKSDVFTYDTKPYGLLFAGYQGDAEGVQLAYEVGMQLPFQERQLATRETFEMQRTVGRAELRIPLAERHRLVFELDGELTAKELRQLDPSAAEREDGDVERARVTAEWWRHPKSGFDTSIGFWYHHLDEDYDRPNDPAQSQRVRRRESMLTARVRVPLNQEWSIEPYVIGGHVDLEDRVGGAPGDLDFDGFEGKIGTPLRYSFSDSALLRIDLSMQLDEFAFGGGGVQFQASF